MFDSITLTQALAFDVLTLTVCTFLCFRHAQISFLHPATVYLIFHVLSFTWRLAVLLNGGKRLFSWPGYEVISDAEYVRAIIVADVALVLMTLAWIKASQSNKKRNTKSSQVPALPSQQLPPEAVWVVVIPSFFIGLIGLFYFSILPGASGFRADTLNLGAWRTSTWITGTQMWSGIALLILIYKYGFRPRLVIPMIGFLLLMGYQGYHRFRLVLPALLLIQFYLNRKGQKWPTPWQFASLILIFLLWFPLKQAGQLARQGASFEQIIVRSFQVIDDSISGDNELVFLDQFAASMTLRDRYGHFFYFETYVPILTLPIPRPVWPDKPAIAFYLDDISTTKRPMGQMGMITTLHGESYISFGYLGVAVISYIVAYTFGRLYFLAYAKPRIAMMRLAYLVLSASMLQVYRDGLTSLIVFTVATMMPLVFLFATSKAFKSDDARLRHWKIRMGLRS